jgi:hypothetical protein
MFLVKDATFGKRVSYRPSCTCRSGRSRFDILVLVFDVAITSIGKATLRLVTLPGPCGQT